MRQAYTAFIMEVGLAGDILQCNFTKFSDLAMEGTWFYNLWEFVFHLKVTINIDPKCHVQPARAEDIPIMERFANLSLDKKNL